MTSSSIPKSPLRSWATPRQHTFSTNTSPKNKKYRGAGLTSWFEERSKICSCEKRSTSDRCNQQICDFASTIFPEFDALASTWTPDHGQDGIHLVETSDVAAYRAAYNPIILRWSRNSNTHGLSAINIGIAKGCTYNRVLIFTTKPMRDFIADGEAKLKAREKFYVAATRARHSVGFVL